jgi:hypothetical protein
VYTAPIGVGTATYIETNAFVGTAAIPAGLYTFQLKDVLDTGINVFPISFA